MRHRKHRRKLQRHHSEREALLNGLVRNLVIHQRIKTTQVKAKAAQGLADRLITLGKTDTVHSRRQALKVLGDRTLVKRLFGELAPLCKDRKGGYTRVLHADIRKGDGAQMAILEFVDKKIEVKKQTKGKTKQKASATADDTSESTKTGGKKTSASSKAEAGSSEQETASENKENFVQNLKKFFKRKGQE